jgi:hypothetical protein
MSETPFAGFSRPRESFYRLPNAWFDILADLRAREQRRRIASLVRLVEYIIKWTWGRLDFEGYVRLTFDELQHGRVIGRQAGRRLRADRGTGLPRSGLNEALSDALRYGLLERITDDHDAARVRHAYRVKIASEDAPDERMPGEPFLGFRSPQTNYFIVPKLWTDLTADETSDVLILSVEYLFRHCWGWGRADETHWFTAEDVALGRPYRTLGEDGVRRYDRGIGYAVDTVRRALEAGVERGWLVWRMAVATSGREARAYTLRRFGWPAGEWRPHPPDLSEPYNDLNEPKVETAAIGDLSEPYGDQPEDEGQLNVPHSDLSEPRTVIPTIDKPPFGAQRRPTGQAGGKTEVLAAETVTISLTLPYRGTTITARGRSWQRGQPLGPDEVLLLSDEGPEENLLAIPETEAARLLSNGLPRQQLGWSPDWFWTANDNDTIEDGVARQKARRVSALAEEMQQRMQDWGAWTLLDALERLGLARSRAEEWLARWGEKRVGDWLRALRGDPTVRSVPAVMYKHLLAGDVPPAKAHHRS